MPSCVLNCISRLSLLSSLLPRTTMLTFLSRQQVGRIRSCNLARGLLHWSSYSTETRSSTSPLLSLSSVEGPTEPPLANSTLSHFFTREILRNYSDCPALICRTEPPRAHGGPPSPNLGVERHLAWDFEEFDRHIVALSRGLVGLGVKKGDRVGVIMGNNRY